MVYFWPMDLFDRYRHDELMDYLSSLDREETPETHECLKCGCEFHNGYKVMDDTICQDCGDDELGLLEYYIREDGGYQTIEFLTECINTKKVL